MYYHVKNFAKTGDQHQVILTRDVGGMKGSALFFLEFNSTYQCLNESALPGWLFAYNLLGLSHFTCTRCSDMFTLLTILTISSGYVGLSLEFFFKLKGKKNDHIKI